MKYRTFGKTGEELSVLGLDTLKLPNFKNTDRNRETNEILSHAIENGINIIDTAYSYYSFKDYENGSSEKYIGDFLDENSYRNEVFISTKLPSHLIASLKQTISISTSCRTSMKNIGTCTKKMEDWNSWTTLLQMAGSNTWGSLQTQKWI